MVRQNRVLVGLLACAMFACGDDDNGLTDHDAGGPDAGPTATLDDFLPPVPEPTGGPQSVWAGEITDDSELIPGPASSGLPGDFYLRNSRARFVIQAAT